MTGEHPEPEQSPAVQSLGRVEPPARGVVEAAREKLWRAVAEEMLSTGPARPAGRKGAAAAGRPEDTRRDQAGPGQ